jgi:hypothetical protein
MALLEAETTGTRAARTKVRPVVERAAESLCLIARLVGGE